MTDESAATDPTPAPAEPKKAKPHARARGKSKKTGAATLKRTRTPRPYPAWSFEDSLPLIEAVHKYGAGEKMRRLTLLGHLNKSPTSSAAQNLITNSAKYGLTIGSYVAEWIEPTEKGKVAGDPNANPQERLRTRFELAIEGVAPFRLLYDHYKGKKLPSHEVMKDVLSQSPLKITDFSECLDTFIVNCKFLGLLRPIAGVETLLAIEHILDESPANEPAGGARIASESPIPALSPALAPPSKTKWSRICFYIAPIGEEGSEARKHSDLFLGSLIEPALKEFDLDVVRADKIGEAGLITSQVLEYIMRSRMAIVDMSLHNPNAFYEMAIRHACKLPVVQITRKADRPPFDVNQVRTIVVDTSDIYSLVPRLETYRSEVAAQVRAALSEGSASNPMTVFFPNFEPIRIREDKKPAEPR